MPEDEPSIHTDLMHHREITLADGRYMIFYTFDGPGEPGDGGREADTPVNAAGVGNRDSNEENDV